MNDYKNGRSLQKLKIRMVQIWIPGVRLILIEITMTLLLLLNAVLQGPQIYRIFFNDQILLRFVCDYD